MATNGDIAQREERTAHALGILLPCRELDLFLAALRRRGIEPELVDFAERMVKEIRRHGEYLRRCEEADKGS